MPIHKGLIFDSDLKSNTLLAWRVIAAGTIPYSQLNGADASESQRVVQRIAKAWATYNGSSILADFNIATITRAALGIYDVVFSAAMTDANYSVAASSTMSTNYPSGHLLIESKTTAGFRVQVRDWDLAQLRDVTSLNLIVLGN